MTSILVAIAMILSLFGFAGGGGSSSGGGGGGGGFSGGSSYSSSSSSSSDGDSDPIASLITLVIIIIIVALVLRHEGKSNIKRKISRNSSTPEEKTIHAEAERIFRAYQADWSNGSAQEIAAYTTPDYHAHASDMLELLQNLHRVNKVSDLEVNYVSLLNPVNSSTPLPANIRVEFGFGGRDEVIDTAQNKTLYSANVSGAQETWNFIWDGKTIKLSGISQPTESSSHLVKSLAAFAHENGLHYSPDWGRYALPARGLIFGGASMKVADINNYVIGHLGNLLIQLYTYAETPGTPNTYYLVGQINVPKNYLGVIVKSKKFGASRKPDKSYRQFELEWPDFNKRYEVFAANRDALPAFELLNPKFMEYLYDKGLKYNLEVVDNVIYIYAHVANASEENYRELLDILKHAYEELKM